MRQEQNLRRRLVKRSDEESSGEEMKATTAARSNTLTQRHVKPSDDPPEVNAPLIELVAVEGNLMVSKLANDTFYDREDGGMDKLRCKVVELLGGGRVNEGTWLRVEGVSLYGVPPKSGTEQVMIKL